MEASFIIPVDERNTHPFRNQPLGSLYLLTILEEEFKEEHDFSLIDLRGLNHENSIYYVPQKDIYFYSISTVEFLSVETTVKKIREVYPDSKHIAGGPHIEIFRENTLDLFDSISLGHGEESIKEIMRDHSKSELKPIYEQPTPLNLNSYPFPSRKYLTKSSVAFKGMINKENIDSLGASFLFSRGCPFSCHFCANVTKGKVDYRSPNLIREELAYLKEEYGIDSLVFKDDNSIPLNKEVARQTLEVIMEADLKWRGQSRANGINSEYVKLAKDSGCVQLAVGIESVFQETLKIINKRIDFDEAKKYLSNLKEEGIERRLLLITGLPGEPQDMVPRTIEFIEETEPSSVLLSLLCPIPGSEMFRNPDKFGMEIDKTMPYDRYFSVFGRFDENEEPTLAFRYKKDTPFGKPFNNEQIISNYKELQEYLRKNNLNF